ncbi:MAG TPA: biopolymer transporter ExbD [Xanthobacteraceae bacterium]|jgi:biopolymer transport protein ExbD|nr:biopolymer transporter ExbD [Xanthobacteraceae bacterium]HWD50574.1 biopolymer transporter ExbD [Rhizomicrobium sp.]
MAMDVSTPDHSDDAALNTTINTTPLVDVMLVLLIIFLITIPVVLKVVPVNLPNAKNIATQSKPQNIMLAVTRDGSTYVNNVRFDDNNAVIAELEKHSRDKPQPEVHIRGDKDARFQDIGKLVYDCQRAGIQKVGFILEPHNGPSE